MTNNEFDIIDHPTVFKWFKDLAKNNELAFISLIRANSQMFTTAFGLPSSEDSKFKYWKQDYMGINMIILTDNVKTIYKVQYFGPKDVFLNDRKMGTYITSFMNKLVDSLLKNGES